MSAGRVAAFRVDASRAIGGGHAMRCLTLAQALAEAGFSAHFFAAPGFEVVVPASAREGVALTLLPEGASFPAVLHASCPSGVPLLIYDHYQLAASDESATRAQARCLLVIDDLTDRPHDCDLLVDQTVGRNPRDYAALVPRHCAVLAGGEVCLLRPGFARLRSEALARRGADMPASTLQISMGLTDVGGITGRIVEALPASMPFDRVDVLLAAAAPSRALVEARAAADSRIHIRTSGEAPVERLMVEADVAIGAAGSTSWERCCLGLPTVMLRLADNQAKVVAELTGRAAAHLAAAPEDAVAAAVALAGDGPARRRMAENAAALVDGCGAQRVVAAIERFLARAG